MNILIDDQPGRIDFVLHPTDLSQASEQAFHHALALAVRNAAQFTLLHAMGRRATDNWPGFPSVRSKLAQWRNAHGLDLIEDRVRRSSVSKVEVKVRDPVAACVQYIERNPVNLIVLATEGRRGLARLVRASRAEALARESRLLTLFVPDAARPFVDGDTGHVTLRRILIPVHPDTDPRPAMIQALQLATLLDDPKIEVTLLHVGDGDDEVASSVPHLPFCQWKVLQRPGDPVDQILGVAEYLQSDAIVMTTKWKKGGFGRSGSGVTESVLAEAPCPLLAVPVDGSGQ